MIVRVDGAGATHDLMEHLLAIASPRRQVLFTCAWAITAADEDALALLPEDAWKPGVDQDGHPEEDKHVAEVTHLMSRAGKWAAGLRWIVRRAKPSRRQAGNLTAFEEKTGWRYSIICTNIPLTGIPGVPGSHHPQLTCPPRHGRSTADGSSPRPSPPTWRPGHGSSACMTRKASQTPSRRRSHTGSCTCPPPRLPRPAADLEDQPRLALEGSLPDLLGTAPGPARASLTSHQ